MSTASAMLNVAVEAPIPIPRVAIATRLKVGRFRGRAERTRQLAANLAQVIEQRRTRTVRHHQLP